MGARSGNWGAGAGIEEQEREVGARSRKWGPGAGSGVHSAQPVSGAARTLPRTLQGLLCATRLPPGSVVPWATRAPVSGRVGLGPVVPCAVWPL